MSSSRYRLARHVHACFADEQLILLDLRRGQYLGISGRRAGRLAQSVEGLPVSDTPSAEEHPDDSSILIQRLLSKGLVTDGFFDRAPPEPLKEALHSMQAGDDAVGMGRDRRHLWNLARSVCSASLALRFRTLLSIVEDARRQRRRLVAHRPSATLDELRECVAAYERLRPILFTSRDQCLFDSLALLSFLAMNSLSARWVIGVKTQPFGAHSWLQQGSVVLNDQYDRVRRFSPILVV